MKNLKVANTERSIRVKFIRETGLGDGKFNLQSEYTVRVFKAKQGIDIIEADDRYVARPYTVLFSDAPPTEGEAPNKVLRNGELWYEYPKASAVCLEQQCLGHSNVHRCLKTS